MLINFNKKVKSMDQAPELKEITGRIIGCAIEVHKALGPGLLESAYQQCLCHELTSQGIPFEKEKPLPVIYKGCKLDCGYRMDILVNQEIVLELKSIDKILPIHEAQLLSYLKLAGLRQGLLINFNSILLIDGIKSRVNPLKCKQD